MIITLKMRAIGVPSWASVIFQIRESNTEAILKKSSAIV